MSYKSLQYITVDQCQLYGAGINLKFYSCNKYDVYLTMICFQDNEDEGNESEGKYHCTELQ